MPNVLAIISDNPHEAGRVRVDLEKSKKGGYMIMDDSGFIVRGEVGEVRIKNEVDRGVKLAAGSEYLG